MFFLPFTMDAHLLRLMSYPSTHWMAYPYGTVLKVAKNACAEHDGN